MYEQFRNDMATNLYSIVSEDDVKKVLGVLDVVSAKYDIKVREMQLIPYDYGMPELVKTYLVCRSLEGLSKNTLQHYAQILKLFFSMIRKTPDDVKTNDVRAWLYSYQKARSIGNRTLESYRIIVHHFFAWAVDEEYLDKNPCSQIKTIKYTRKPRKAMQQIELEYIREACQTPKERAIVEVLYSTGCRVSELSILKKTDINWEKKEVLLFGKGAKYRTSYLNAKAIIAIKKYLETRQDDEEYVFVTDRAPHHNIGKAGLERIVRIIASRVKDNLSTHVTPHVFRHTTATIAMGNGMPVQDVQAMLGHANINTTMVYAEVNSNEVKNMHVKCVV